MSRGGFDSHVLRCLGPGGVKDWHGALRRRRSRFDSWPGYSIGRNKHPWSVVAAHDRAKVEDQVRFLTRILWCVGIGRQPDTGWPDSFRKQALRKGKRVRFPRLPLMRPFWRSGSARVSEEHQVTVRSRGTALEKRDGRHPAEASPVCVRQGRVKLRRSRLATTQEVPARERPDAHGDQRQRRRHRHDVDVQIVDEDGGIVIQVRSPDADKPDGR